MRIAPKQFNGYSQQYYSKCFTQDVNPGFAKQLLQPLHIFKYQVHKQGINENAYNNALGFLLGF